ncbi:hypothetical protein WJX73_006345 [Symbiochloris irregularis]|uniref:HECT domain-containing protein n=1 Tax=Symbiochloris irregularis TaxID=706552 RepID=A0AAW1NMN2_9CHLO
MEDNNLQEQSIKSSAQEFEAQVSKNFNELRSRWGLQANDAAALALKMATCTARPPVDIPFLLRALDEYKLHGSPNQLATLLRQTFSSADTLAATFYDARLGAQDPTKLCVNFADLQRVYSFLMNASADWQAMLLVLCRDVVRNLSGGSGLSKQRVVCILLANPILEDPMAHELLSLLADKVGTGWSDADQEALVRCLQEFSPELMQQAVGCLQNFITIHTYDITGVDAATAHVTQLLSLLHRANEATGLIPYTEFYNGVVNQEDFDVKKDYLMWRRGLGFSFCGRYSFLYSPAAKAQLLRLENRGQQMNEFQGALYQTIVNGAGSLPFLYLRVRRGQMLVNDTMLQLQNAASRGTLKFPLRVKFADEDGVDEGGIAKVCHRLDNKELLA